jgi:ubiquinone/menaquinone biosynthesis C-methylase UbiE
MTNAHQTKEAQRQLWAGLAEAWEQYDNWYQRQTHTVTEWLCRVADLRGGQRVLDLASGSGQPALTAARLVKPGGTVVATDMSEEMLRVARRKANMADLDNVEFKVMDMENIDFPDESFDSVTCRWGLMFSPDPARTLAEVHRVLKQHRPVALTTFASGEQNPLMKLHMDLASQFGAPALGPDAPTPLSLSDTSKLQALLKDAGFKSIEIEGRPFTWDFGSPEEFWKFSVDFTPLFKPVLAGMDEAQKAKLKEALLEAAAKYREGGRLRFPALAMGAYAQK